MQFQQAHDMPRIRTLCSKGTLCLPILLSVVAYMQHNAVREMTPSIKQVLTDSYFICVNQLLPVKCSQYDYPPYDTRSVLGSLIKNTQRFLVPSPPAVPQITVNFCLFAKLKMWSFDDKVLQLLLVLHMGRVTQL